MRKQCWLHCQTGGKKRETPERRKKTKNKRESPGLRLTKALHVACACVLVVVLNNCGFSLTRGKVGPPKIKTRTKHEEEEKNESLSAWSPEGTASSYNSTFVVSDAFGEIISLAAPTKEE